MRPVDIVLPSRKECHSVNNVIVFDEHIVKADASGLK